MQAFWRAHQCRKHLREEWRHRFRGCFPSSLGDDILSLANPLLPLFHRVYRADRPEDLPMLTQVSEAVVSTIVHKDQSAIDVDRASFYALKMCLAILQTLEAQRYSLD